MKHLLLLLIGLSANTIFSQSTGSAKIIKVNPDKNMAYDEARIIISFKSPNNTSASKNIKVVCNNDSAFPTIDATGTYTLDLDPGKYKFRFAVPYWHTVKIDNVQLKQQTTTYLNVKFEAQELRAR